METIACSNNNSETMTNLPEKTQRSVSPLASSPTLVSLFPMVTPETDTTTLKNSVSQCLIHDSQKEKWMNPPGGFVPPLVPLLEKDDPNVMYPPCFRRDTTETTILPPNSSWDSNHWDDDKIDNLLQSLFLTQQDPALVVTSPKEEEEGTSNITTTTTKKKKKGHVRRAPLQHSAITQLFSSEDGDEILAARTMEPSSLKHKPIPRGDNRKGPLFEDQRKVRLDTIAEDD